MKIIWSPLSVKRLENIFEYIAKENDTAAHGIVERIMRKVETLSEYPGRGRKVPEANSEEISEVFEGEYRILYRVGRKRISILSIRNFKQLLSDEDMK